MALDVLSPEGAERKCARCPQTIPSKFGRKSDYCDICRPIVRAEKWRARGRRNREAKAAARAQAIQVCAYCSKEFTAPRKHKHCSDECSWRYSRRQRGVRPIEEVKAERKAKSIARWTRVCECCGKTFIMHAASGKALRGEKNEGRFCSRACQFHDVRLHSARKHIVYLISLKAECGHCGQAFIKGRPDQRYCTEECRVEAGKQRQRDQYALAREDISPQPCKECGQSFVPHWGSLYCSDICSRRNTRRARKHIDRIKEAQRKLRIRSATIERVNPIEVFERDGWRCQLCLRKTLKSKRGTNHPRAPELDHIVPIARGGEHSYKNTQCACRQCNSDKNAQLLGQLRLFG